MLTVKQLKDSKSIEDACALSYQILVETGNSYFLPANPSQFRVKTKNNRRLLIDRFTDNAIWFGAFDGSNLIGCIRATFMDERGKLEIEGYKSSHVIQEYLPSDKKHCIELTRVGCLPNPNGLGVLKHLFLAAFKYCDKNQYSVCGAFSNSYIINFFEKIGFPLKIERAFKYEKQDPSPVNFYFADSNQSEIKDMILRLDSYERYATDNTSKIFEALELVAPILPTLIYWHDTEGVVLGLNALCLDGMGVIKKEQVLGKIPYEFYPKKTAAHILEHNNRVMKTGEVLSQDEQIEDIETGKIKIFRSTKAPLYNDQGKIIGIIGSSVEVTKERQIEALKAEFVENMQHDIRTPLSGIKLMLSIISKANNLEKVQRLAAIAENATDELLLTCDEIIDFGDDEQMDKPIYSRKFSLIALAHGLLNLNSAAAFANGTMLELNVEDKVPDVIKGNDYRLRKILINLLSNAVKFTEKGSVILNIKLINRKTKQATLRFEVIDNGIGIPEDKIEIIFEKFTKLTATNTGKFKSTGLGLHIVKKFASEINADLDIRSTVGKGTTFTVDACFGLPLVDKLSQVADGASVRPLERHLLIKPSPAESTLV